MPTTVQRRSLHHSLQHVAASAFLGSTNSGVARTVSQYLEVVADWLPPNTPALPVTSTTLSAYALVYTAKNSAKSLDSLASRIKLWATAYCRSDFLPTAADKTMWRVTKRALARQDADTSEPTARKIPLRMRHLRLLFRSLDLRKLDQLQFYLAVVISHQACLRGVDVVSPRLRARDIEYNNDGATLLLRQHKTSFKATKLGFANRNDEFSVPHLLKAYMRATRLDRAAEADPRVLLFPTFANAKGGLTDEGSHTPRWTIVTWRSTLRTRMAAAGFQAAAALGTHALRAGGATDYLAAGCPASVLMVLGRWASEQVIYKHYDYRDRAAVSAAVRDLGINDDQGLQ